MCLSPPEHKFREYTAGLVWSGLVPSPASTAESSARGSWRSVLAEGRCELFGPEMGLFPLVKHFNTDLFFLSIVVSRHVV